MKICNRCNKNKELSEFHKRNNIPSGVVANCKDCCKYSSKSEAEKLANRKYLAEYRKKNKERMKRYDRNQNLKSTYGIDLLEYEKMYIAQSGLCKICNTKGKSRNDRTDHILDVDHCHKTNKIRGLLCNECNNGLGRFYDSTELLMKAIEYLKENNI